MARIIKGVKVIFFTQNKEGVQTITNEYEFSGKVSDKQLMNMLPGNTTLDGLNSAAGRINDVISSLWSLLPLLSGEKKVASGAKRGPKKGSKRKVESGGKSAKSGKQAVAAEA